MAKVEQDYHVTITEMRVYYVKAESAKQARVLVDGADPHLLLPNETAEKIEAELAPAEDE